MKINKYIIWASFNIAILIFSFYTITELNSLYKDKEFCILGLFCSDDHYDGNNFVSLNLITPKAFLNCSQYDMNKEGMVMNKYPYNESFFETLDKIINISEEDYSYIIKNISKEGSFQEIYNKYLDIFQDNYSLKIDKCAFPLDYLQNIGELISNNYHGDCDDYATWLYLIAKEKGLKVRYVIGYGDEVGHAWIQIKIDNDWIDYNSVINSIGEEKDYKDYTNRYYYDR